MSQSTKKRINTNQKAVIARLKVSPIVEYACKKTGISRATYYRWRKENPDFAEEADKALVEGKELINDMAESQLMSAIKDKHMTAIIFWLKHHHKDYATRVEITTSPKTEKLSEEQEELVNKSLVLAGLLPQRSQNEHPKI